MTLVGFSIAAGLALSLGRALAFGARWTASTSILLVVGILVTMGGLWLNRHGRSRRAAQLLAFILPVLAAGLALGSGRGFRDPAILMMPATLVFCGVLLDRRTLVAMTTVTLAATTVVLLAEGRWLGAAAGATDALVGDALDSLVILGITSLGVGVVAGHLRRSVERLCGQEVALRASEERYRGLIDLAADAILLAMPAAGVTEVNRRASELTGYSRQELIGRTIEDLFSPFEVARVPFPHDALARGETVVAERMLTRKDGTTVPVEMSSKQMPDGTCQCIFRDVSERHRTEAERRSLEARLRQAQKMEAVGRLAGGIAHDFNNLLTAITGSATLALRHVPEESSARRWLREIDGSAWRGAALTRHLLAFSRQQVIEPRVVDLRSVVEGASSLVARTIGEDVRLRLRLADSPCLVELDPSQIEEVILNLATNARDAMPDGGLLTLEVGWATSARLGALEHLGHGGGRVASLRVSDTGQGMAEEVRARIFEPFFTTKPSGSGTGLGLAMVYGAVEQNGGCIDVESVPGRGSTFRIFFREARRRTVETSATKPEEPLRGTETVLLVEDEQTVREVTAEQLESLGYRVLSCATARDALTVATAHEGPIDLLLTDVVMPGMDGRELATRLSETRAGLRVLYATGHGEDVIARHGVVEPGILLVEKPYSLETLARQVRRALAAG